MGEAAKAPRIGDSERDDAVGLLREHMAAGRLDHLELDERLGRALAARTQPELEALFVDLPGRRPGQQMEPATPARAASPAPARGRRRGNPWWCHWMLFVVVIALSQLVRSAGAPPGMQVGLPETLGFLVPATAVWVWWLGPRLARELESRHDDEPPELGR